MCEKVHRVSIGKIEARKMKKNYQLILRVPIANQLMVG